MYKHNPLSNDQKPLVYGATAGLLAGLVVYYLFPKSVETVKTTNTNTSGTMIGLPAGTLGCAGGCGGGCGGGCNCTKSCNKCLNPSSNLERVWNPSLNRWEMRAVTV